MEYTNDQILYVEYNGQKGYVLIHEEDELDIQEKPKEEIVIDKENTNIKSKKDNTLIYVMASCVLAFIAMLLIIINLLKSNKKVSNIETNTNNVESNDIQITILIIQIMNKMRNHLILKKNKKLRLN